MPHNLSEHNVRRLIERTIVHDAPGSLSLRALDFGTWRPLLGAASAQNTALAARHGTLPPCCAAPPPPTTAFLISFKKKLNRFFCPPCDPHQPLQPAPRLPLPAPIVAAARLRRQGAQQRGWGERLREKEGSNSQPFDCAPAPQFFSLLAPLDRAVLPALELLEASVDAVIARTADVR